MYIMCVNTSSVGLVTRHVGRYTERLLMCACRPSSLTSISVLQRIRGVTIMRYINLHFTYLLTYFSKYTGLFSKACSPTMGKA